MRLSSRVAPNYVENVSHTGIISNRNYYLGRFKLNLLHFLKVLIITEIQSTTTLVFTLHCTTNHQTQVNKSMAFIENLVAKFFLLATKVKMVITWTIMTDIKHTTLYS